MAGYIRAIIQPYNSLSTSMPHSLDDIAPESHDAAVGAAAGLDSRLNRLRSPRSRSRGARHRRCLDQPDHGHRHVAGPRGLARLLDRARPRGAEDPGRRRIACTAGEPPALSTFNITKVSARLDFATSESDFRGWRRIFLGTRIRDLDRSCQTVSGVDLSDSGHRVRITFPSAQTLPNPDTYTVTIRTCTDAVIDDQFACHETDDGPVIQMHALAAAGAE